MFYSKEMQNALRGSRHDNGAGMLILGMLSGAAITGAIFIAKEMKKNKCSIKKLLHSCRSDGKTDRCDDPCDEYCDPERSRNSFDCHGEEYDTAILHSHGCLGYPHDNYGGFADSKGDRPNDLSNPEIEKQGEHPSDAKSPAEVKNARGKSNPQPENKINEVEKK